MSDTPVPEFPEYDRGNFAFGFPQTEIAAGGIGTVAMSPTCDNIVYSVVERLVIPDLYTKKIQVEYALVTHWHDYARELLRDMPGTSFSFDGPPVGLKHLFRPHDVIILTVRNKSPEPTKFQAAIVGWAYNASRESDYRESSDPNERNRAWEAMLARRKALGEHIKATEKVLQ